MIHLNKIVIGTIGLAASMSLLYISCKKKDLPEQPNFEDPLAGFPPLEPGDKPGTVGFTLTPTNDGFVNLKAQFSNGTPFLWVTCNFAVGSFANLLIGLPGYGLITQLDNTGAGSIDFNRVKCSLNSAQSNQSFVNFSCSTLQGNPQIPSSYTNGPDFIFRCPF